MQLNALFCCLWRNVEASCHKHFFVSLAINTAAYYQRCVTTCGRMVVRRRRIDNTWPVAAHFWARHSTQNMLTLTSLNRCKPSCGVMSASVCEMRSSRSSSSSATSTERDIVHQHTASQPRNPKHIQVEQPDKNNQYLFTKFSANFHAWQDFLPVTTEKNLSGRLSGIFLGFGKWGV